MIAPCVGIVIASPDLSRRVKHGAISSRTEASVIQKMMPPHNIPVAQLERETGISNVTLYTWRKQAREQGAPVPGDGKNPEQWSAENRFAVLMETAALNSAELSEYCRSKGLYPEQIARWKADFIAGSEQPAIQRQQQRITQHQERKRIQQLEKEADTRSDLAIVSRTHRRR